MHDPRHCGLDGTRTIAEMTSASLQDESSQMQNGGKDVMIAPDAKQENEGREERINGLEEYLARIDCFVPLHSTFQPQPGDLDNTELLDEIAELSANLDNTELLDEIAELSANETEDEMPELSGPREVLAWRAGTTPQFTHTDGFTLVDRARWAREQTELPFIDYSWEQTDTELLPWPSFLHPNNWNWLLGEAVEACMSQCATEIHDEEE